MRRLKNCAFYVVLVMLMLCFNGIVVKAETFGDYTYQLINYDSNKNEYTEVSITKYNGTATEVTIPSSIDGKMVTTIDNSAFYNCSSLTSITIPEGVTTIGTSAFNKCSSLTSVTIPEGVTSIGGGAFRECSSLTSITIPEGVTSIGNEAFYGCSSLTSITIPEAVTSIVEGTFYGCSSLTSITIPEGVTSIEDAAFRECSSLTSITIPEGVTSIEDSAFSGCSSLTSITIPEGVTSIGDFAFYGCSSLESIKLPDEVVKIGDNIVEKNNTMIYCSEKIAALEKMSQYICFTPSVNTFEESAGKNIIGTYDSKTNIMTYTGTGVFYSDYRIDERLRVHVRKVKMDITDCSECSLSNTFSNCRRLEEVELFEGITRLSGVFSDCVSLKKIILPDSISALDSAFRGCSSLTSISIPNSVNDLQYAFYGCSSLKSVVLPAQSVKASNYSGYNNCFMGNAFAYCDNLTCVIIPASYKRIVTNAFEHSENVVIYGAKGSYAEEYANNNVIPFAEHNHEDTEIEPAVESTCSMTGLTEGTYCSVCGAVVKAQETVEKKEHTIVIDEGRAATCTETGLTEGSHCSVCNQIIAKRQRIDATGHTLVTDPEVKATCTEDGKTEGSHCSVCNEILTEQTVTKAAGHNWDDGTLTKQPTWKENGIITYKCKNCGLTKEIQTATIEAKIEDSINKQIEDKTKVAEEKLSTVETAKTQAEEKASAAETAKVQAEEKASAAETAKTQAEQRNAELEQKLIMASVPEKLKAKHKKKSISLSWKKPTDAEVDGYKIYISTKKNKGYKQVSDVADVKAVLKKGLKLKKTYYIKVRGYKVIDDKYIFTKYSNVAKVKTK